DIEPDERAASSKHETHESADVAVLLHPVSVVDPDKREVLHVVKDFEQRNTYKNIGDEVIAVPPKRDAGNKQSHLHRVGPLPYDPHPPKMDEKQNRNCDGREKNQLLTDMNCRRRDKRSATHVVRIKRIAQPVWRESHRRGEPDYAHREIKSSREC